MASSADNNVKTEDNLDLEYYSSNGSSLEEDDKIFLHIGIVLKSHIEEDFKMVRENVKPILPSKLPVVTILEHFVKSYAMKVLTAIPAEQKKPKRRHSIIFPKKEPKESTIDFDEIRTKIDLCKEVADGLRIYFNFILKDFLLYPEEKDSLPLTFSLDEISKVRVDHEVVLSPNDFYRKPQVSQNDKNSENTNETETKKSSRLRSQSSKTTEETEKSENNISAQSSSSGDSLHCEDERRGILSKSWFPLNAGLNPEASRILDGVFEWRMLPDNSEVEPSMIFGINYLSRLVVKLPEFLSSTPMNEEKLALLLKYLDDFVLFLEENEEMFGSQNYEINEKL